MTRNIRRAGKKSKHLKKKKPLSRIRKPEELSLEEWQVMLRVQMAKGKNFKVKNLGSRPVFSDFEVYNPETKKTYHVMIHGAELGVNYCSCPDFAVNTLGTCKHVEFVLRRLRRRKETERILEEGYVPEYSSVALRYGLERRVVFNAGKAAGEGLKKLAACFFDIHGFLTLKGFYDFDKFVERAKMFSDDIKYHDDAMRFIASVRDAKKRGDRVKKIFSQGIESKAFNKILKTDLLPYQREGVLFAATAGRSLIADDMGLGKTVQAIAGSEVMSRYLDIEKVLVICPTSLKYQWAKEINRFTDRSCQVLYGLSRQRGEIYKQESFYKITNYDVIHRDIEAIEGWAPDLIILDEAQRIKNWKTRLARSVKKLSSPYAIVLTGTPLENRLEELHSIVEFLDRHHLGPLFRFLHTHQVTDKDGRVTGYKDLNRLGESLAPVLLRRKKDAVLDQLPERSDKNYFVRMTAEQIKIHEENAETVARIAAKWRRYNFLTETEKRILLVALQNMRMVCDDTYLVDKKTTHGNKIRELELQLGEIFEAPRGKVVIFSEWVRMLELAGGLLDRKKWRYEFLHGGVPGKKRGELIRAFEEDPECRVFLSSQAGGVGLNLQSAETVINLDLPWNPAVLEQRIGRVHRLGQKRPVRVINFIAEGSIEHGMLDILAFKKSMFSGVLDGGSNNVFMGETRFKRFMKTVEKVSESMDEKKKKLSIFEAEEAERDRKNARREISDEQEESEVKDVSSRQPATFNADTLKGLLKIGIQAIDAFSGNTDNKTGNEAMFSGLQSCFGIKINHDGETGKKTINIPVPDEAVIEKIMQCANMAVELLTGIKASQREQQTK
ncbi:MAG: DEAD/DEAH box helicase [Candidatus Omnitrophota bacterium]